MEQPVNDDLVPLLDSVAGLLEKERELGELKLEAAQHEGQQWRERYERLKGSLPEGDEGFVERPPNGPPPRLSAWELLNELHDPNVRRQMAVAQSLALQRMMLDDADFEALSNKLKWLPALRHVNLGSNFLTDEACLSIKMLFTRCGGLETLDFSHNALGKQSLLVLGTKLKQLRPLQRLCIEGNTPLAVTPNAGDELGNALRNASERLSNLFELRLTLNDEAEPSHERSTTRSRVQDNDKDTTHWRRPPHAKKAEKIFNSLKFLRHLSAVHPPAPPKTITHLGLTHARLAPESVQLLVKLKHLVSLDLSYSYIGPAGAILIARELLGAPNADAVASSALRPAAAKSGDVVREAEALQHGRGATRSSVGFVSGGEAGQTYTTSAAGTFREGVSRAAASSVGATTGVPIDVRPPGAKKADGDGGLGGTGGAAAAAAKKEKKDAPKEKKRRAGKPAQPFRPSLTSLNLEHNGIGNPGAVAIARSFGVRSASLTDVNLSANRIGLAGASALADALPGALVLSRLDIGFNYLPTMASEKLARACRSSPSLLCVSGLETAGAGVKVRAELGRALRERQETMGTQTLPRSAWPAGVKGAAAESDEGGMPAPESVPRLDGREQWLLDHPADTRTPREDALVQSEYRRVLPAGGWRCAWQHFVSMHTPEGCRLRWGVVVFPASWGYAYRVTRRTLGHCNRPPSHSDVVAQGTGGETGDGGVSAGVRNGWAWWWQEVIVPCCFPGDTLSLWIAPEPTTLENAEVAMRHMVVAPITDGLSEAEAQRACDSCAVEWTSSHPLHHHASWA